MLSEKELREFIYEANRSSYASGTSKRTKGKDGSTSIIFEKRNWKSHDNYFGGEPYGGRQVIFYKGNPIWMTVYYGYVDEDLKDIDKIYSFLMKALSNNTKERPQRGPKKLKEGGLEYSYKQKGNITMFNGIETIIDNGKTAYKAWHIGGYIEKRK